MGGDGFSWGDRGSTAKFREEHIVIELTIAKDVTFAGLDTAIASVFDSEETLGSDFAVATSLVLTVVLSIDLEFIAEAA